MQALELRKQGKSYKEIGEALGISLSVARRNVMESVKLLRGKRDEEAWEVVALELMRLDAQVAALWPQRADPTVSNALIRVAEHRAKLLALFAPTRHEITGADGTPLSTRSETTGMEAVKEALAGMFARATAAAGLEATAQPEPPPDGPGE